ncbi:MAG TPA: hypothetical protein VFH36_22125 [Acidimicrobiales bacterium]|nr:hypothetical protein [Acidimicrobiales bacterium]
MSAVPVVATPIADALVLGGAPRVGRARPDDAIETETVDDLVERVRPLAARAVDALEVAATLEAGGITDDVARVGYGYADVFVLAEEVHRRVGPADATVAVAASPPPSSALGDVTHGLLYLLPAAVFPAALAVLGRRSLVLGLVLAAFVGWVWAGGATWLAYRLLGRGHAGSAARVLRWAAVAGLPVTATASVVVIATTRAGYGLAAMATAQMAFQMAAAVLMFYRREIWLFAAMVPGAAAGVAYLVAGDRLLPMAVVLGAGSVAVTFGIALLHTMGHGEGVEPRLRDGMGAELGQLRLVLLYTALSAAYLLHAQGRYMLDRFDIVVAVVPLIVGMGVVEWRARRFGDTSRALLRTVRRPREFVAAVRIVVARDVAVCVGAVAIAAAALIAALHAADLLSAAAVLMTTASVVLGGAYFAGFVLANMGRFAWLCGSLATCLAAHLVLTAAAPRGLSPVVDTLAFLGSAVLLFLLLVTALVGCVGQARHHR